MLLHNTPWELTALKRGTAVSKLTGCKRASMVLPDVQYVLYLHSAFIPFMISPRNYEYDHSYKIL